MSIDPAVLARLEAQTARADLILFTGAGFSSGADDSTGTKLPAGRGLTEELWKLAFPTDTFVPNTRLGDVFFAARMRGEAALKRFLNTRLAVRAESLPDWYRTWFSMPWQRCYTVNIDDLELAVSRRYKLPRPIRSISATSGRVQGSDDPSALEVIHLNGAIWDDLQDITFSPTDYGARLSTPDAAYIRCASDMVSRPVVVVGTELDESPLWQYLEARRVRGRGLRELRPGSYLVTSALNPARLVVLRELNVDLVRETAQEFSADALVRIGGAVETGLSVTRAAYHAEVRRSLPRLVSDLAREDPHPTEYLLGSEPTWADIRDGRAIQRDFDAAVYDASRAILISSQTGTPIVLTGTAGSGKSTSLMRLGLRLAAEGIASYWIDERSNIDAHMLRTLVAGYQGPIAILIDDADVWGRTLSGWARELPAIRAQVLLVACLRSSKVDDLLDPDALAGLEIRELSMPHLSDNDIEALIGVLDENNRLGILKGKSHAERVGAFKEERTAGRQLLVAMIQATSGQSFREKAFEEFTDLPHLPKVLYAIACFVHSRRFTLDREELVLAVGQADNEVLNEIEGLVKRALLARDSLHTGYRARHRVIADQVVQSNEFAPILPEILDGICFAFATRVSPDMPRHSRPWRRFARFISHDLFGKTVDVTTARNIYARLEQVVSWDYHYWLQRGSYELEHGNLDAAGHFLDQARSLRPDDLFIEVEYAYLLMSKAARSGAGRSGQALFEEGLSILQDLITRHGKRTAYPYDVLGRQTLNWIEAAQLARAESRMLLEGVIQLLEQGVLNHGGDSRLQALIGRCKHAWLRTAVA